MLRNFMFQPLFHEIANSQTTFSHVMCVHVYRDKKTKADRLSKEGVEMHKGDWEINESHQGQHTSYFHESKF
jgi:hypothetical protein